MENSKNIVIPKEKQPLRLFFLSGGGERVEPPSVSIFEKTFSRFRRFSFSLASETDKITKRLKNVKGAAEIY